MKNLLVTFSGGRTSAFMAHLINNHPKYKEFRTLFVFANTGKEKEETLEFVNRCGKEFNLNIEWVEAWVNPKKGKGTDYKIVQFNNASRRGEPFEDVIKKYGLPSKLYRHCTRELKEVPIHKYAKEYFKGEKYYTALGIRADEKHRLKKKDGYIYPLAKLNIDEPFIRRWWSTQSLDLKLKDYEGNCDLCFLKTKRKKLTILRDNPSVFNWWNEMEINHGKGKQPIFDVYRGLDLRKLLSLSKKQFRTVEDLHELRKTQGAMFEQDMDMEFDCFCKSN